MSPMQDQPVPAQEPTSQQLVAMVQQAANLVVQQLTLANRGRAIDVVTVDAKLQEIVSITTLMHCHLDMLTKLLVLKKVCTQEEINKYLIAEFVTAANELAGKPQIVVPRH